MNLISQLWLLFIRVGLSALFFANILHFSVKFYNVRETKESLIEVSNVISKKLLEEKLEKHKTLSRKKLALNQLITRIGVLVD